MTQESIPSIEKLCSIEGCDIPVKNRGWCNKHYLRWKNHGDPTYEKPGPPKEVMKCSICGDSPFHSGYCETHYDVTTILDICAVSGCEKEPDGRGYCLNHYTQWKRRFGTKKCSVEGCDLRHHSRGFCEVHARRFRKNGQPGDAEIGRKPSMKTCALYSCEKIVDSRGFCSTHYRAWLRFDGNIPEDYVTRYPSGLSIQAWRVRYKYGDDAVPLHEARKNGAGCEVCGSVEKVVIDHCHKTNKVRGLLCKNCNTALGFALDNPEVLRRLADYVDQYILLEK